MPSAFHSDADWCRHLGGSRAGRRGCNESNFWGHLRSRTSIRSAKGPNCHDAVLDFSLPAYVAMSQRYICTEAQCISTTISTSSPHHKRIAMDSIFQIPIQARAIRVGDSRELTYRFQVVTQFDLGHGGHVIQPMLIDTGAALSMVPKQTFARLAVASKHLGKTSIHSTGGAFQTDVLDSVFSIDGIPYEFRGSFGMLPQPQESHFPFTQRRNRFAEFGILSLSPLLRLCTVEFSREEVLLTFPHDSLARKVQ